MDNPKSQHYVPVVYLKEFCNETGKLDLYDKEKKEFRTNIKPEKIAKKSHLYTVSHNDKRDFRIEAHLCEIETNYAKIKTKIKNRQIEHLDENDYQDILWFLSFLYARNLSKINRNSEIINGVLNFMANPIKENENFIQANVINTMYETAETIYKLLNNEGNWYFFVSRSDSEFITTDDPMENMLIIPLSCRILFMRVTEKIDGLNKITFDVPHEWVNDRNFQIASTAKRYVFSSNRQILKQYI